MRNNNRDFHLKHIGARTSNSLLLESPYTQTEEAIRKNKTKLVSGPDRVFLLDGSLYFFNDQERDR